MRKITISLLAVLLGISISFSVNAGTASNVSGWAWSENTGWLSFNNTSGGGSVNYGVSIDSGGNFSGYAWSEHIGWIDFAPSGPYPASPNYSAQVNWHNGDVSGWARALAYGGGWDGWISLRNNSKHYGVSVDTATGNFSGYAWSDVVMGWINFRGVTYGVRTLGVPNEPPNKPTPGVGGGGGGGGGGGDDGSGVTWDNCSFSGKSVPVFNWIYSDPDGDPQTAYEIEVDDNASFQAPKFNHLVNLGATSYALDLSQDDNSDWITTLAWNTTYYWRVRVRDDHNNWSDWSNAVSFKTPKHAYPWPGFSWWPTDPVQGEVVVFTPDQTGLSYFWTINQTTGTGYEFVDGTDILDETPHLKFSTSDNRIKLKVTGADSYSCESSEVALTTQLPLPEYHEVPPIIWFKKALNALASLMDGLYIFKKF